MISNADDLDQQASSLIMLFLIAFTSTLVYFLSKWKTAIIDLTVLQALIGRFIITVLIFSWVDGEVAGFEQIDIKQLADSISVIYIPCVLLFSLDWRIELCLAAPINVFASIWTIR